MHKRHRHFPDRPPPLLLSFGEVSEIRSTTLRFQKKRAVIWHLHLQLMEDSGVVVFHAVEETKGWPVMATGNMD